MYCNPASGLFLTVVGIQSCLLRLPLAKAQQDRSKHESQRGKRDFLRKTG